MTINASPEVIAHAKKRERVEINAAYAELQASYNTSSSYEFHRFLQQKCKPISRLHPERSSR